MWYEILPTMGIIYACFVIPQVFLVPTFFKVWQGKAYKRYRLTDWWTRWSMDRDEDLTGWAYDVVGLEGITDKPSGPTPFDVYSHKDTMKHLYY